MGHRRTALGAASAVCREDPSVPSIITTTAIADAEAAWEAGDARIAEVAAAARRDADRHARLYAESGRAVIEAISWIGFLDAFRSGQGGQ